MGSEPPDELSFHLRVVTVRGANPRRWLAIPLKVGDATTLRLVPNSATTRSVLTPPAFAGLRALGFVGASITHIPGRAGGHIVHGLHLHDHPLGELEIRVRDVDEFRRDDGEYAVDGYLGMDFFWRNFRALRFEFRTARMTLEFQPGYRRG